MLVDNKKVEKSHRVKGISERTTGEHVKGEEEFWGDKVQSWKDMEEQSRGAWGRVIQNKRYMKSYGNRLLHKPIMY